MKKSLLYLIMCIGLSMSAAEFGPNVDPDFSRIVNAAVDACPAVRALSHQADADLLNLKAENALADPEVTFDMLVGKIDNKYELEVAQSFDWPGVYPARRRLVAANDAYANANIAVTRNELRREISQIVIDIISTQLMIKDMAEIARSYSALLDLNLDLYKDGNVSILDVNKLRYETATAQTDLEEQQELLDQLLGRLAELTGSDTFGKQTLALNGYPLQVLESHDYYVELLESSPKLAEARARKALSRQGVEVARRSSLPGFTLGYKFTREDFQNYNGFTFGLTLPVWSRSKRIKAAEATEIAADFEERATRTALEIQLEKDFNYASKLEKRIKSYAEAVRTTDNFALLKKAYEAGQISLTQYIIDVNYFIEAKKKVTLLNREYAAALLTLQSY